jgi:hypothetical protein
MAKTNFVVSRPLSPEKLAAFAPFGGSARTEPVTGDNGQGIQMDNLRLLVTKGLIERHGGNFSITSPPNGGIMERLSFPAEGYCQRETPFYRVTVLT